MTGTETVRSSLISPGGTPPTPDQVRDRLTRAILAAADQALERPPFDPGGPVGLMSVAEAVDALTGALATARDASGVGKVRTYLDRIEHDARRWEKPLDLPGYVVDLRGVLGIPADSHTRTCDQCAGAAARWNRDHRFDETGWGGDPARLQGGR